MRNQTVKSIDDVEQSTTKEESQTKAKHNQSLICQNKLLILLEKETRINAQKLPKMKNIVLFTHVLPQKQYNKHSDNMDINKNQKKNLFVQTIEEVKKINQE